MKWIDFEKATSEQKKLLNMELYVGQKFTKKGNKPNELRIMAIVDKYVMFRYKGCYPSVLSISEFFNFLKKNGLSDPHD